MAPGNVLACYQVPPMYCGVTLGVPHHTALPKQYGADMLLWHALVESA